MSVRCDLPRIVRNADVVYPNSETESAFLRSYTIENAIKSGIPFWSSLSGPNSAGRGCAFHQRKFQYGFAIASGNEAGVMTAVQQDLESRLSRKAKLPAELVSSERWASLANH